MLRANAISDIMADNTYAKKYIMTPEEKKRAARAKLRQNLEEALRLAKTLNDTVAEMFPEAAEEVDEKMQAVAALTIKEKLALGEDTGRELTALAFKLAPEKVLDELETTLAEDVVSRRAADALIKRF